MNYIDIIVIVLILIGFILGFKDGLVRKVIGLMGLVLAVILAFEFSENLGVYLAPIFNDEIYLANFIAGILIFFTVIFIVAILKRLVHPVDKVNRFLNQLFGGISGMLQMILFICGFFLFLNIFNIPNKKTREQSLFYTPIFYIIPTSIDFILGDESKTKDMIINYIEKKEGFAFPADSVKIDTSNNNSEIIDSTDIEKK